MIADVLALTFHKWLCVHFLHLHVLIHWGSVFSLFFSYDCFSDSVVETLADFYFDYLAVGELTSKIRGPLRPAIHISANQMLMRLHTQTNNAHGNAQTMKSRDF